LYLGAMITGMGIFIGCGYGSETGIGVSTLMEFGSISYQICTPKKKVKVTGRLQNTSINCGFL
jgi:hypothetical protein